MKYTILQIREIFHLEFLRWFSRKVKCEHYALKGGVNLRFFFNSIRYSEDMDIDIHIVGIARLRDTVMNILASSSLKDTLGSFGISDIIAPDISKAKQTETTQRFKIHLITTAGEDLFTKVEFSRRPSGGRAIVESVGSTITRPYKVAPVLVAHYDVTSAVAQKIRVLANRNVIQARDIFDLYILSSHYDPAAKSKVRVNPQDQKKALANLFLVEFDQFRDTVVSYLSDEDRTMHDTLPVWDEIRLTVSKFMEEVCINGRS